MSSAAASASAFSLRHSSRSTSARRVVSGCGTAFSRRRLGSSRAVSAADRHASNCAVCRPSRRSSAPSSVSLNPCAAIITRSFCAPVHCFARVLMAGTLRAAANHRDSVTWDTPTSPASRFALIAREPTNRCRTLALNAVVYCFIGYPLLRPLHGPSDRRHHPIGDATTILTQGVCVKQVLLRRCQYAVGVTPLGSFRRLGGRLHWLQSRPAELVCLTRRAGRMIGQSTCEKRKQAYVATCESGRVSARRGTQTTSRRIAECRGAAGSPLTTARISAPLACPLRY